MTQADIVAATSSQNREVLAKLIRKLRWIGMEDEAVRIQENRFQSVPARLLRR